MLCLLVECVFTHGVVDACSREYLNNEKGEETHVVEGKQDFVFNQRNLIGTPCRQYRGDEVFDPVLNYFSVRVGRESQSI